MELMQVIEVVELMQVIEVMELMQVIEVMKLIIQTQGNRWVVFLLC